MQYGTLGNSSAQLSRLGLGCMGMSEFYGPSDDKQSLEVLERAFELGVTFYDTADMYGSGHNEELLARFMRGKRDKLRLATKFGIVRNKGEYARTLDNSPEYARSACEASLQRLDTDYIDLYYAHRINPEQSIEAMMRELARLVDEGKIRAVGLSEPSAEQLRAAHAVFPVSAVQSEYSLWTRDVETNGVFDACRELGVSLVPYSPLGRGFLTGKISSAEDLDPSDFRRFFPRLQDEHLDANLKLVESVKALAEERGATPAQVALAWVVAQGEDVFPIPGTRRIKYLEDNLGALEIALSEEDVNGLSEIFHPDAALGDRYTAEGMKGVPAKRVEK